jgi:hypothetical protein
MPGVGFEPTCPIGARAFKAPLYASSSTRAGLASLISGYLNQRVPIGSLLDWPGR